MSAKEAKKVEKEELAKKQKKSGGNFGKHHTPIKGERLISPKKGINASTFKLTNRLKEMAWKLSNDKLEIPQQQQPEIPPKSSVGNVANTTSADDKPSEAEPTKVLEEKQQLQSEEVKAKNVVEEAKDVEKEAKVVEEEEKVADDTMEKAEDKVKTLEE